MKGTILYAEYDEGTGVSTVTKATKYGTFTRSVRVHPDDKDIANQYDGCLFAEMKCDIAAYQERAKFMRERAKGMTHMYNVLYSASKSRGTEEGIPAFALIYGDIARQIIIANKFAEDAFETVRILKEAYKAFVENTLQTRRELQNRIVRKKKLFDV